MPKKIKVKKSKGAVKNAKGLDIALQHYQSGNLGQAEERCRELVSKQPNNADAWHLLGLIAGRSGQYESAVNYFNKAIQIHPEVSSYYNNLGLALQYTGSLDNAIENFNKAIEIKPDFAGAYNNLGLVFARKGMIDEAIENFKKTLEFNPENAEAYNNLGISFAKKGMTDHAIENYKRALSLKPDDAEIYFHLGLSHENRGTVNEAINSYKKVLAINSKKTEACYRLGFLFKEKGMLDEAIECYEKVLILNPDYAGAYNNLGNIFSEKKMKDEAIENYKKALVVRPDYAETYCNLGNILKENNLLDEAIKNYKKSLELKPDYAEAYNNLGYALAEQGLTDRAIEHLEKALMLNPDFANAYHNLGFIFACEGMVNKAIEYFKKALDLDPDCADTHKNLGVTYLLLRDYDQGWKEYEWRLLANKYPTFPVPSWDGSHLKGRTLIIHAEQGVGDEIMFASCLPDVMSRDGNFVLECDKRLMPLFSRSYPEATVIPRLSADDPGQTRLPQADMKVAIGSLPLFFRPDLASFPRQKSYLMPDKQKVEIWGTRFKALGKGLKVGISWLGGKETKVRRMRSIALEQWSQVFSVSEDVKKFHVPGIQFINLQYGDSAFELKETKEKLGVTVHDWDDADPLKDLDNFAAQIAALDLVISVDNSTVHMTGALGVPVWVFLPFACDWRWMQDVEDTPWYESVRLYRQRTPGEWGGVLECVESDLKEYVTTGIMPLIDEKNSYKERGKD